jgi:hypothetical protein
LNNGFGLLKAHLFAKGNYQGYNSLRLYDAPFNKAYLLFAHRISLYA